MTYQLPLMGLQLRDDATFANFTIGENAAVLKQCQAMAVGGGEQYLYLWGQQGAGCSHLLQACCHRASEQGLPCAYFSLADVDELSPEMLEGLESLALLCLDDLEAIAAKQEWEHALFHLYNRMRDAGTKFIAAGPCGASQLPLQLPDLRSRLAWGLSYQVHELKDADKIATLQMRASNRGFDLPAEVANFLLTRCSRNMRDLADILNTLDEASLVSQRKLTIPFVKQTLQL